MEKWARGITAIVEEDLGDSPAAVNRETGVMYVNPAFKGKLDKDQWYFIALHELGHLTRQTRSELEADEWAHKQYLKEGRSLKKSVTALTDLLSFKTEEDFNRAYQQLQRSKKADTKIMSYINDQRFYGARKCDKDIPNYAYFRGAKKVKQLSPSFDADKAEFFGEYAGTGATVGAAVGSVVPVVGTAIGGAVGAATGLLTDIGFSIWGGRPEDTSDIGYQAALAQREAERYAIAQAKAKQAAAQAEADAKKKQTRLIVITLIGIVVLIGGSLLFFTKKK